MNIIISLNYSLLKNSIALKWINVDFTILFEA